MKKLIGTIIFSLMLFGLTNAQTVTEGYYNNGYAIGFNVTMDSTVTGGYYIPAGNTYFDWTPIIGNTTIYATYSLLQSHWGYTASNDTCIVILQGKDLVGNTINMDTIATVLSGITQALATTQASLTLSSYMPFVRLWIKPKVSGAHTKNGKAAVFNCSLETFYAIPFRSVVFR